MSRTIIHDKSDFFKDVYTSYYEIHQNDNGWYQLEKSGDLKEAHWRGDPRPYTVIELDDLRISKPRTYSLLCVLVKVRDMQCGTCDTPYIHDDLLKELTGIFYNWNLLTDEGRAKLEIDVRKYNAKK